MADLEELGSLGRVQAYRIARELRAASWADSTQLMHDPRLPDVARQITRAVGSIAATISEGYARRARAERIRFYEYALGSTNETRDWYETAAPALTAEIVEARLSALLSIRRLLLTMIRNERASKAANVPIPSSADNKN